jgi:uroporphyrinogen-III synthase
MLPAERPLTGYRIGVSAANWADEQIALWSSAGAKVVDDQVRAMIDEQTGVVVFTSRAGVLGTLRSAVRMGLTTELARLLDDAYVVAANPEAASQLGASGFTVDATSRGREPQRVAAVIDHPSLHGRNVAIQLDGHASDEWAAALTRVGIRPRLISMYQWGPPKDVPRAKELVRRTLEGRLDAVSFISRGAVEQFGKLVSDVGSHVDLSPYAAACIDSGCATAAQRIGFGEVFAPERAGLGAMVRTVARAFSHRAQVIVLAGRPLSIQGRHVRLDGEIVLLSEREHDVLARLAEHPGAVVSKSDLVQSVWGEAAGPHVAEVSIARLRQRLGATGAEIETVIRRGYRLHVDDRPPP